MKKRLERALLATRATVVGTIFAVTLASGLSATPVEAKERVAMFSNFAANMAVGVNTTVPLGYARFCADSPAECGAPHGHGGMVVLTDATYGQLLRVNEDVNRRIQPMTDIDHYGEIERWTYPTDGYGDCEDYVLLKRRTLIDLGWPADTLLVTVVRDRKGDGHAVLTVVTDRGDLVLDNQEEAVVLWHETGYRFVKRQSQENVDGWVSLGDVLAPYSVGRN